MEAYGSHVDVRDMGAAALTKLMAKKSQQKERKVTLISADQYNKGADTSIERGKLQLGRLLKRSG
jgi:hypothetical protein